LSEHPADPRPAEPQTGDPLDVSVIVPVLNETETLATLVDEIRAGLATLPDLTYEVVFVDDGSTDDSWKTIAGLTLDHPQVRGVRLRRNMGKAAALKVGVENSVGATVVTMDADLQDDASELPRFLAELDAGADLVSGWKRDRKDPLSKRLPSKVFNGITGMVTGVKLHDHNCGFKAARREIYEQVPLYGELHRYVPVTAVSLGYRIDEIPVNHRPRTHGKSKYGHLFGGASVVFGLVGFLILSYLTGVWIFTDEPIGTRPLLFLGILLEVVAVQLLSLGVLSELVQSRTAEQPLIDPTIDRVGTPR
jgi:glycosyltransferase involved in cell wall biosynthesis